MSLDMSHPVLSHEKYKGNDSQIFHNLMFCSNYTNKMPLICDAENRCRVVFTAMEAEGFDPCPCNK